jgi:hypothetical protein
MAFEVGLCVYPNGMVDGGYFLDKNGVHILHIITHTVGRTIVTDKWVPVTFPIVNRKHIVIGSGESDCDVTFTTSENLKKMSGKFFILSINIITEFIFLGLVSRIHLVLAKTAAPPTAVAMKFDTKFQEGLFLSLIHI